MQAAAANSKRPALENTNESDCISSLKNKENPEIQHKVDISDQCIYFIRNVCTSICCASELLKPFQPTSRESLASLNETSKVFCLECKYDFKA